MNTKRGLAVLAGAAAVGLAVPAAGPAVPAKALRLTAAMTPKQVVTPRNKPWRVPVAAASARASFSGTLSADRRRMSWRIRYSGLGRPATVIADIHVGKPGRFGAVLVRLCTACKSGQSGTKRLKASVATQLEVGNSWVTLITPRYPNGVVRGQIRAR